MASVTLKSKGNRSIHVGDRLRFGPRLKEGIQGFSRSTPASITTRRTPESAPACFIALVDRKRGLSKTQSDDNYVKLAMVPPEFSLAR